ncbi:Outer membrane protein OmpA [Fibrobacter sp. UWH9]|uniref:OmpA family protein n=1 Tax=unclassified Fibrobacter TaxID=2634177 RepID=UPI000918B5BF|nr:MULTISPECIES: OmpA family protein [unclassified Fibrobacter]MCQ2100353.1 OmpA family protein [Fibrobacter sp.]MDO4947132.1 OmpA family protein [Fibrobacter sp.]SHG64150.1 Outer membrane protein OmpA [Fibrobacter sp. UWH9]SHK87580.1 Outer membrane protein OmpA [Fibrobacter sp. UWH5]SHL03239.1 Outer membrane protein OmpA [Fibrobacter sp. UWH6]
MTLKKLVLITAGAMLLTGTAMAKNINVPGDYQKIADALGNADAGDTILVKRGTYNENITLVMGVVLKGEDPLTTIIDGGRRGPTVMGTSGAEMSHFTVKNGLEGILCENAAPYIHHCYVMDNKATGIGAFISLPHLRNNVVYGNRWSGILAWGAKSLDAYIEQNVVLRNGYSGLALKGPTNVIARNNIFMENHYYGVFADPAAGQTKVEYNNIYKNYYPFNQFIKVNRTNVSLDPKFMNPSLSKPNFYCQSTSPMLKRGKGKLDIGLTAAELVKEEEAVEETRNPDTDGDGLCDPWVSEEGFSDKYASVCTGLDNCPEEAEDFDGFQDDDGCPDADNDRDGLCDPWVEAKGMLANFAHVCKGVDLCPEQAETLNSYKDEDGCPDEVPQPPKKVFVLEGVNFESGKATITPDSYISLMKVVDIMETFTEATFEIVGHTDNVGNKDKNKQLSADRAAAVKNFLVEKGINESRMVTDGMGDTKPVASNKTPEGRAQNRRIEFIRTDIK